MEHMIGLTDTAYLGRVGEVELGASALAGVYYLVIYMLGFGFSVGAQVLMARRNGEGEYKRIGEVFTQGGLFLFLLAAVLFTASNLLTPYLLHRMIGSEEVYRATMSYLDWRVYGFFFSFIAVMFRAFYVSTTNTKIDRENVDRYHFHKTHQKLLPEKYLNARKVGRQYNRYVAIELYLLRHHHSSYALLSVFHIS